MRVLSYIKFSFNSIELNFEWQNERRIIIILCSYLFSKPCSMQSKSGAKNVWLFRVRNFVTQHHCTQVQKCKSCTSDSLSDPNPACEADFDEDKVPSVTCGEEYGNQFCFVLVTKNKAGDQREMWNSKKAKEICRLLHFVAFPRRLL